MLTLITAVPGSGKTLFAVQLLEKYIAENKKLIEAGKTPRDLFADIDGLEIPGVLPAPADWRECPDGSVVIYDECQQRFGPDGQGRSGRSDIQDLEVHRHRGFDIILITQHPKLLHAHVRRLIGRHHHLFRMFGTESAKVFTRDGAIDVDKPSQLLKEDAQVWAFPKELYGKYQSATVHTHKRKLPAWLKRSIAGMAVAFIAAGFLFHKASAFFAGETSIERTEQASTVPARSASGGSQFQDRPLDGLEPPTQLYSSACITMGDRCSCYHDDRTLMDISHSQCVELTEGPLRRLPQPRPDRRDWEPPAPTPSGSEGRAPGLSISAFSFGRSVA